MKTSDSFRRNNIKNIRNDPRKIFILSPNISGKSRSWIIRTEWFRRKIHIYIYRHDDDPNLRFIFSHDVTEFFCFENRFEKKNTTDESESYFVTLRWRDSTNSRSERKLLHNCRSEKNSTKNKVLSLMRAKINQFWSGTDYTKPLVWNGWNVFIIGLSFTWINFVRFTNLFCKITYKYIQSQF